MTNKDSGEIWSFSMTSGGIGATAMSLDAHYRAYFEPLASDDPIRWTEASAFYAALARLFEKLGQNPSLPLAICVTACPTACFVDASGRLQSPFYLDTPTPMPRRDVPACFADEPTLFSAYRNSLMRRLQSMSLVSEASPVGLSTAAGCFIRAMTGAHLDALTPVGTPDAYPWAYHELHDMYFHALGVDPTHSVARTRAGYAIATISEMDPLPKDAVALDAWRHKLVGIPIFHTGTATAAAAYACAADPLSWSCTFGWSACAHWTASATACAAYEITVKDADSAEAPAASVQEDAPKELSRDDWTRYLSEVLPLDTEPGSRRNDRAYGMKTPSYHIFPISAALEQARRQFTQLSHIEPRFAEDLLSLAPVGSAGLHLWPSHDTLHIAGAMPAHTPAHYLRASLESMAYTIKAWRDQTQLNGLGPIRALFEPPWDISCAQILSDILETTVITPDLNFATTAAIGAAISLMRDLNITAPEAKPHIDAYEVTPSQSAVIYQAHARIHAFLSKESDGYAG